jgi:hypothetical protein
VPEQDFAMGEVRNKAVRCDILIAAYEDRDLLGRDAKWSGGWLTHFGKTYNLHLQGKRWRQFL